MILYTSKYSWLVVVLGLILFSSCTKLDEITIGEPQNVTIKSMSLNSIDVLVELPISNPARAKLKVTDMDLKIWIDEKYIGRIKNIESLIIDARSDSLYMVPLKIIVVNFLKSAALYRKYMNNEHIEVKLEGEIRGKLWGFRKKINVLEEVLLN